MASIWLMGFLSGSRRWPIEMIPVWLRPALAPDAPCRASTDGHRSLERRTGSVCRHRRLPSSTLARRLGHGSLPSAIPVPLPGE